MNQSEVLGLAGMIASASGLDGYTQGSVLCSIMFFLFLGYTLLGRSDK